MAPVIPLWIWDLIHSPWILEVDRELLLQADGHHQLRVQGGSYLSIGCNIPQEVAEAVVTWTTLQASFREDIGYPRITVGRGEGPAPGYFVSPLHVSCQLPSLWDSRWDRSEILEVLSSIGLLDHSEFEEFRLTKLG